MSSAALMTGFKSQTGRELEQGGRRFGGGDTAELRGTAATAWIVASALDDDVEVGRIPSGGGDDDRLSVSDLACGYGDGGLGAVGRERSAYNRLGA